MYKVAVVMISVNQPYWSYVSPCIQSLKKFFLKGHQVDFLLWSDMPETVEGAKLFHLESMEWPMPTLMRFHVLLKQEELLREYDFVLYIDSDMLVVSPVGDEILGDLVAAQHPMYATKRGLIPPYEPNPESQAFIPRPGRVITKNGKKMFEPLYFAGGFQGGRSDKFIEAMKKMKDMIDKDFSNNYIPIWNDESIWNAYLFKNPPSVVLSPSYIYPDSLIKSYYIPIWGKNYVPKIITLTKPFTTSREAGIQLQTRV